MPTQVHIDRFDFHLTVQKQAEKFRDAIGAPKGRGVRIRWPLFINVAFDFGPDVPSDDDDCIRLNLNSWKMQGKFIDRLNPHAVEDYLKLVDATKPEDEPKKPKQVPVKVIEAKDEVKADVCEVKDENQEVKNNPINPDHYKQGKVECIDCIESATSSLTGFEGFCTGNAIKYLYRWKQKGGKQDLEKSRWYINRMLGEKPC